jgi:hypothetical protein
MQQDNATKLQVNGLHRLSHLTGATTLTVKRTPPTLCTQARRPATREG